jgi:hypothetical protein
MYNLSESIERKFIDVIDLDDEWEIESEEGWVPASKIMKTVEYEVYQLSLDNGLTLDCADDHIVFLSDGSEIFVKDLTPSHSVKTKLGNSNPISVKRTGIFEHMYDVQVNSESHSLYTNNILSHNTSVMAAFIVWYSIFHEEKTTAVLANKGDAAQEIMDRIRLMLENLPFFLQPGVSIYNRRSIELDNGSKIFSAATGAGGIRGRSCVAGTTKVTIRNKITGEVKLVNIDDLAHILNKSVASNKSIEETNEQPGDIIKIRFQ